MAVKYFLPIDKKDFAKQAAAYGMMAAIGETQTLPTEFIGAAKVVSVSVRQGGYDDTSGYGSEPFGEQPETPAEAEPAKRQRKPAEAAAE